MTDQNEMLSEREREILQLVATGAANKEIARQLLISPNTVKVHLRNIFAKIGVASRTEATLYAMQIGLIHPTAQDAPIVAMAEDHNHDAEVPTAPVSPQILQAAPPQLSPDSLPQALRRLPRMQMALLALFGVLLISTGVLAARWFTRPIQPETQPIASQSSNSAAVPANPWRSKANLPAPRKGMGAVAYNNGFYLIGGETVDGPTGSLLLYQPLSNEWQQLASKPIPVSDVQATLLGEKIYVPGGRLANGRETTVFEVYDPRADAWSQLAPLPAPISAYSLAAFEGRLYLFGGKNGERYLNSVYEYTPDDDRWQARTPLQEPSAFSGATVVGNKIFIMGGFNGQTGLSTNLAYYPSRDANAEDPWEAYAPLPGGRYAMAVTTLSNVVYLVGGLADNNTPATPSTLQFLSQANQWSAFEAPTEAIGSHGALLAAEGFLHYMGGENDQGLGAAHQAFQALYTLSIPLISTDK